MCRCAGQPSSDLVDACMHGRGTGGASGGMSVGSTMFLLMAVVGVMTAAGYTHYKRTQTQMRDQVREERSVGRQEDGRVRVIEELTGGKIELGWSVVRGVKKKME